MVNLVAVVFGFLLAALIFAGVAAVVALPFMWGWNYAITHAFGAPEIGWLHSFVLLFFVLLLRGSASAKAS